MSNTIYPSFTHVLCLVFGLLLFGLHNQGIAGALYKWVDEDGQIRYSDRLPPSQVKKKHQQLSTKGVVLSTQEAAKSDNELAIEAEEARKLEKLKAEEAKLKLAQDKKDRVLLLTFSSEEELGLARDDRLDVIDSVISLIDKSIVSTQEKLTAMQQTADELYLSQGKEVPGGLAQKIEHSVRKVENRTAQLNLKQSEKDEINQQYDLDLARYRLLKTGTN